MSNDKLGISDGLASASAYMHPQRLVQDDGPLERLRRLVEQEQRPAVGARQPPQLLDDQLQQDPQLALARQLGPDVEQPVYQLPQLIL